jgi:hypothetical protein
MNPHYRTLNSKKVVLLTTALGGLVLGLAASPPAHGAPSASAAMAGDGAANYQFTTPAGVVKVTLPDDIRAGDTISGTIVSEPSGDDAAERQRNADTLEGYVLEVDKKSVTRKGRIFAFAVAGVAALTPFILKDKRGRTISQASIPVGPNSGSGIPSVPVIPPLAQAGQPLLVTGPFDGNAENTKVSIGGKDAAVLAESPRGLVVRSPFDSLGPANMSAGEQGNIAQGTIRNVRVILSASKTRLVNGETASLGVEVLGLGQQSTPTPVRLTATGPVQMQGGNVQTIMAAPGTDGIFHNTRILQASAAGAYSVSATVLGRSSIKDDPIEAGAIDMNGIGNLKQLQIMIADLSEDDKISRLRATEKALKKRISDATDDGTKEWLNDKLEIIEDALEAIGA